MRKAVLDLCATRKLWRVTPGVVESIRSAFGEGWSVVNLETEVSSDGDGAGPSPAALEAVAGAEVYFGFGVSRDIVGAAGNLRWIHTALAGVGGVLRAVEDTDIVLTNSRGVYADPIADWTITAIGYLLHGYSRLVAAQRDRRWAKQDFTDGSVGVREFRGTRVGIFGLGGIGTAVSVRCLALGMEVNAIRRNIDASTVPGVTLLGDLGKLETLAARSDVLVICAPSTDLTRGAVSASVLAALPSGAYVINVARGDLISETALLDALDGGHVGGCALDVFSSEPLDSDSRFWDHPDVLVSPHVSPVGDGFWGRQTDLIVGNVECYLAGHDLQNVVDIQAGY